MLLQNHPYRGDLTLQSHGAHDVFAKVPVGDRNSTQTDEMEAVDLKTQRFFDGPEVFSTQPNLVTTAAQKKAVYEGRYFADYEVVQGKKLPIVEAPVFFPLDVDVRANKRIVAQFHDRSTLNSLPTVTLSDAFLPPPNENRPFDKAYVVTLYLEIEELLTANSK